VSEAAVNETTFGFAIPVVEPMGWPSLVRNTARSKVPSATPPVRESRVTSTVWASWERKR
jgi:hypothetical protein